MAVMVPVSWGEVFDKITIMQIKVERIHNEQQNRNVRKELAELETVLNAAQPLADEVTALMAELRAANTSLWDIEDAIRDCERAGEFDDEFIRLARAVYFTNDKRADLKKQINMLLGSGLIEEKSYTSYT